MISEYVFGTCSLFLQCFGGCGNQICFQPMHLLNEKGPNGALISSAGDLTECCLP